MFALKPLTTQPDSWWQGKTVLVRLDLNVPISGDTVTDDYRITRAWPTVEWLLARAGKVILLSHADKQHSLAPVAKYLQQLTPVTFVSSISEAAASTSKVVLLENLRLLSPGEEANDPAFAQQLASLGQVFVNEAFSVSHREHASVVGLPKLLPSFPGQLFIEEVTELSKLFQPTPPFVVILGGAKFGTKLPLIEKFLPLAEKIFIGGALAHPFFRHRGWELGKSLIDDKEVVPGAVLDSDKIVLPTEVVVSTATGKVVKAPEQVIVTDNIIDAGPAALGQLEELLSGAKTVLWNGPLGNFEIGFRQGTEELAKLISSYAGAYSVVGGGDTLAAIKSLNLLDHFGFVSTGGGAMLDFLSAGTLFGVKALGHDEVLHP
jgi:phosphoglycerate kinase